MGESSTIQKTSPNLRVLLLVGSLLLTLSGCTRFHDEFSNVHHQCQINPDQAMKSQAIVKFVKPDGTTLTDAERSVAQVRLVTASASSPLELTPGSCVELPPADGVVQIFIPGAGIHLSHRLSSKDVRKGFFEQWTLEPTSTLSAALPCPAEGWFVDDTLSFPLTIQSSSSIASSAIRLYLTQPMNGTSIELFNKPYGQEADALPASLSLKSVNEGSFMLHFEILQSMIAWDEPMNIRSTENTCPLTVIHKSPSLAGLNLNHSHKIVVKAASTLPWTPADARDRLFVCKEPRGQDEDTLAGDACEAKSHCRDPQAYTAATKIVADEAGVFDYFSYAVNPTGKRSDLQCKRVVVVKTKGNLEVSWDDPALNVSAASLTTPVLDKLGASIRISHQERRDSELLENLQCRIELLQDGVLPLSSSSITCRGGRCDGKSLGEFIPCDAHVEASFPSDWLSQGIRPTLVKLHVRTTDGTDTWTEAAKSFWVHPDRWRPTLGPFPRLNDNYLDISDFLVTASGQLYGHSFHDFASWSVVDGTWKFPAVSDFLGGANRVFRSESGEAFVYASSRIQDPILKTAVYHDRGYGWEPIEDHLQLNECANSTFFPHPGGGFFCQTRSNILVYEQNAWKEQPLPKDEACEDIKVQGLKSNFVAIKANTYWYACGDHIYRTDEHGQWKRLERNFNAITFLLGDRYGRVWLLDNQDGEGQNKRIAHYWDQDRWYNVELPAVVSDLPAVLNEGPEGSVLYYDHLWNSKTQTWERLPGLDRITKDHNFMAFAVDDERVIFAANDGLGIWTAKGIQYSPLSWYRLSIKDVSPEKIALTTQNELWFIGESDESAGSYYEPRKQSYRLDFKNFSLLGQVSQLYLPSSRSRSSNIWLNPEEEAILQIDNRGLAYPTLQGFETQWLPQNLQLHASAGIGDTLYAIIEDGSLIAFSQGKITTVLPTQPGNPAGYRLTPQAATQTLWVQGDDSSNVWRIRKEQKVKIPLPEALASRPARDLWEIRGQLILAGTLKSTGKRGYFRYVESQENFEAIPGETLKLPSDCTLINVINSTFATCLVYAATNADRYLINLENGGKTKLVLPSDVNIYRDDFPMIQTKRGDFVVLGDSAIYRGSGQTWTPVMDFRWLSSAYPGITAQRANKVVEDAHQRLWVTGDPYRLLMIDAP